MKKIIFLTMFIMASLLCENCFAGGDLHDLFLDRLTFSAKADYANNAFRVRNDTTTYEKNNEKIFGVGLDYSLGLAKLMKTENLFVNGFTLSAVTSYGNTVSANKSTSGTPVTTKTGATYRVGVGFAWCIGSNKPGECK